MPSLQFMLQANIAVAQQIAVHVPEQALLRRHEQPIERRLVSILDEMSCPVIFITVDVGCIARTCQANGSRVGHLVSCLHSAQLRYDRRSQRSRGP